MLKAITDIVVQNGTGGCAACAVVTVRVSAIAAMIDLNIVCPFRDFDFFIIGVVLPVIT
jgi:hypothetical protein